MKYKTGDRFVIEIDKKFKSDLDGQLGIQNLYRIKGFKSLVFDDNGLDRLEQIQEHDRCDGCEYEDVSSVEYPCSSCSNSYYSRWTPKKTEEIQVGDEVKHDEGAKGVVYHIISGAIYALVAENAGTTININRKIWPTEKCHRTGKTYPGIIKALEELPKEGE